MENREQDRPVYVTFAPPPSGEDAGLIAFFWDFIKLFGRIAQKLNPIISIAGCFVASLVAHHYGLGLWSMAIGLAVAVPAWFIGGGAIYWSIFTCISIMVVGAAGYLLFSFFMHLAS